MSSLYESFKTDPDLEIKGINLDYGNSLITVARAGGSNKKFLKVLERLMKPYRRAIQTETMDNAVATTLLHKAYAEAIVLRWETRKPATTDKDGKEVEGKMVVGIEGPDGNVLPFTADNITQTFDNLPDLFADVQEAASKASLYRATVLEEDAGN